MVDLDSEALAPEAELGAPASSNADPVYRMMLLQMRQTNQLVKALAPRAPQDPIASVLSDQDNASGNYGSGSVSVKGHAARELFLSQLSDDRGLAEHIRKNARMELGIATGQEPPSMLRTYMEQRGPLGTCKLLTQFGYMLAWGWEMGETSQNQQLVAFCGRMMQFIEQSALNSGRTGLAWLMTGLPEPNFQQLALNRRRATLTPFAKLAPASWVAANLSYLKDVDVFETRLRQLGGKQADPKLPDPDAEEKAAKAKAKPKKTKGKGAEKGPKGADALAAES